MSLFSSSLIIFKILWLGEFGTMIGNYETIEIIFADLALESYGWSK